MVLKKTLQSPLDSKEIKLVSPLPARTGSAGAAAAAAADGPTIEVRGGLKTLMSKVSSVAVT